MCVPVNVVLDSLVFVANMNAQAYSCQMVKSYEMAYIWWKRNGLVLLTGHSALLGSL
jgi:hypothetical protein